jgi:hypothetical protein
VTAIEGKPTSRQDKRILNIVGEIDHGGDERYVIRMFEAVVVLGSGSGASARTDRAALVSGV